MKKWIVIVAVLLLAVIVLSDSYYTVEENQYACTFRFSEIVNTESEAGLHLKVPFVDQVTKYSNRLLTYDTSPQQVIT